jgi:hypothetical protein
MPRIKHATVLSGDMASITKEPVYTLVESYHTTAKGRLMRDIYAVNLLDKFQPAKKRTKNSHEDNGADIQSNDVQGNDQDVEVDVEMAPPPARPSKAARRKHADSERRKVRTIT